MLMSVLFKVGTGAYKRLLYEVPKGKPVTDTATTDKITWATWTRFVITYTATIMKFVSNVTG